MTYTFLVCKEFYVRALNRKERKELRHDNRKNKWRRIQNVLSSNVTNPGLGPRSYWSCQVEGFPELIDLRTRNSDRTAKFGVLQAYKDLL